MIDRRFALVAGAAVLLPGAARAETGATCQSVPVKSEAEAIAIARRALVARYGAEAVAVQEPLRAPLGPLKGRWMIVGAIDSEMIGGNFNVLIDGRTGCVLAMQIDV